MFSKSSMISDLADIHANNKIRVPSYYSKQSYVNTSSDRRNSSGNGFRLTVKCNQGALNSVQCRQSYSVGNSPVRISNENQDEKQVVFETPQVTRKNQTERIW